MKVTAMPEGFEICLEAGEKLEVVQEDEHTLMVSHSDRYTTHQDTTRVNGTIYIQEAE